jgi:type II secretory pathway pseudopilin PulG
MRPGSRLARAVLPQAQRGAVFIFALVAVALVGTGLALAGPVWSQAAQREREQELLRVGGLYAEAIRSYRAASPGSVKQYPLSLDELVLDPRFVGAQRHIRRLYRDPLDPARPWGLVRDANGRIRGVYSQSTDEPIAQAPQWAGAVAVSAARRYADWQFIAKED